MYIIYIYICVYINIYYIFVYYICIYYMLHEHRVKDITTIATRRHIRRHTEGAAIHSSAQRATMRRFESGPLSVHIDYIITCIVYIYMYIYVYVCIIQIARHPRRAAGRPANSDPRSFIEDHAPGPPWGTSLRPPGDAPGTPEGPLMDHKKSHISTNIQRQKL